MKCFKITYFQYLWLNIRTICFTLKEETFAGRNSAKYLHFAGINFRGWRLMKNFAGINFRGWNTFKRFHGNKKRRKSKYVRRNIRFYCTVLRWDTWPVLKSLKKSFKKLVFHFSWVLNFWNFKNATIIWYHNYKSIFFSEYSQMTTFLENFAGRNFRGWRLLKNFAGINFRGFG